MIKAKPFLIVVGSLLIGIMLGFLISAQLRHKRMRSVRLLTSERYFRDVLYKVIEPTDELKKQLEPIIQNYGKEGRQLQREFRKTFEMHNDEYWDEIKALLSDDQLKKLEEYNRKRQEERKRFFSDTVRTERGDWDRRVGMPPSSHRSRYDRSRPDSLHVITDTSGLTDSID